MNFLKIFEKPKPKLEKTLDKLSDQELLEKFSEAKLEYDGRVRGYNFARNPSTENIRNTKFQDDLIKRMDEDTANARQSLRKVEEEVRKRKLSLE